MHNLDQDRTAWFMRQILPHEPALRKWLSARQSIGIDVDDIIQETYTALASRDTIADIRYPRAYLFQIAHSLVIRHIRRSRVVSFQAMEDLNADGPADDAPSPEQTAIDRDELRHLAVAIAAMPPQMRKAFTLRRMNGLSQREIADQLHLSENTVEKHISRGIRFLTDWFGSGGKTTRKSSKGTQLEIVSSDGDERVKSGG